MVLAYFSMAFGLLGPRIRCGDVISGGCEAPDHADLGSRVQHASLSET